MGLVLVKNNYNSHRGCYADNIVWDADRGNFHRGCGREVFGTKTKMTTATTKQEGI